VLFEQKNENGLITGFTSNYVKVATQYNSVLVNKVARVKLTSIDSGMVTCVVE